MELTIQVVTAPADKLSVLVHGGAETTTVLALKQLIEQQNVARFPVAAQRLIFQGQILQDDKLLSEYNISSGMALHLTLAPGVAATIAAAAAAEAAAPPGPSTVRAAFASLPPSTRAPSSATLLRQYLQQMQAEAGYETAIQTLQKICENIVGHPTEEKYRKLRVANAALKARLFDRSRGMDCLKLLGFQEGVEQGHLVLVPNAELWENLTTLKRVVDEFANTPVPSAMFGGAAAPTSGFPGAFGGQGTANLANMAAQASAMMQNPMMAQMISSHPMMQQMAQANPMIAQALQNPAMLQQMLGSMQSNPMMMQQLNQMMQDPNAMQQMQQMMGGISGGMPGGGGGFPSFPSFGAAPAAPAANPFASAQASAPSNPFAAFATPTAQPVAPAAPVAPVAPAVVAAAAAPPAPASAPAVPSAGAESLDTTYDEDEIAQAIARSLEEH